MELNGKRETLASHFRCVNSTYCQIKNKCMLFSGNMLCLSAAVRSSKQPELASLVCNKGCLRTDLIPHSTSVACPQPDTA